MVKVYSYIQIVQNFSVVLQMEIEMVKEHIRTQIVVNGKVNGRIMNVLQEMGSVSYTHLTLPTKA